MESMHPCPRGLQRRGYEDLTLNKQTAVSQTGKDRTTLGRHRGPSAWDPPSWRWLQGQQQQQIRLNTTSLIRFPVEHRQGQHPLLLFIATLQAQAQIHCKYQSYLKQVNFIISFYLAHCSSARIVCGFLTLGFFLVSQKNKKNNNSNKTMKTNKN